MAASCKIVTDFAESSVTLVLNGRLDEGTVRLLETSILKARRGNRRVYLDLSEVTLIDRKAARYFYEHAPDIEVVNCPAYLKRWIGQENE